MGGFGPGYEQALQLCMVEFLRYLVAEAPNAELWDNEGEWKILLKRLDEYEDANRVIRKLGPSGAMVGAAKSLAVKMYRYTPIGVMQNDQVKDRHIQVSKNFPSVD